MYEAIVVLDDGETWMELGDAEVVLFRRGTLMKHADHGDVRAMLHAETPVERVRVAELVAAWRTQRAQEA